MPSRPAVVLVEDARSWWRRDVGNADGWSLLIAAQRGDYRYTIQGALVLHYGNQLVPWFSTKYEATKIKLLRLSIGMQLQADR